MQWFFPAEVKTAAVQRARIAELEAKLVALAGAPETITAEEKELERKLRIAELKRKIAAAEQAQATTEKATRAITRMSDEEYLTGEKPQEKAPEPKATAF